jgi:alanine dehydrogenase
MKTLLLKKEEVSRLICMKEVIGTVEEAYKAFNSDQVEQPDYIGMHLPSPRGKLTSSLVTTKPMK